MADSNKGKGPSRTPRVQTTRPTPASRLHQMTAIEEADEIPASTATGRPADVSLPQVAYDEALACGPNVPLPSLRDLVWELTSNSIHVIDVMSDLKRVGVEAENREDTGCMPTQPRVMRRRLVAGEGPGYPAHASEPETVLKIVTFDKHFMLTCIDLPDRSQLKMPPHEVHDYEFAGLPNQGQAPESLWHQASAGLCFIGEDGADKSCFEITTHLMRSWAHHREQPIRVVGRYVGHPLNRFSVIEHVTEFRDDRYHGFSEFWENVRLIPTCDGLGVTGLKYSICLMMMYPAQAIYGIVLRVGQYCHGLVKVRDQLSFERWEWIPDDQREAARPSANPHQPEGGWRRLVKIGQIWMPCAKAFAGPQLSVGDKFQFGPHEWHVKENYCWI